MKTELRSIRAQHPTTGEMEDSTQNLHSIEQEGYVTVPSSTLAAKRKFEDEGVELVMEKSESADVLNLGGDGPNLLHNSDEDDECDGYSDDDVMYDSDASEDSVQPRSDREAATVVIACGKCLAGGKLVHYDQCHLHNPATSTTKGRHGC